MKKLFLPLICFIILAFVSSTGARMNLMIVGGDVPAAASGHNPSLSSDGDLFGWWQFEEALTSGVNSETLSDGDSISYSSSIYKEGSYSAYFNGSSDTLYRADGDLNAGFPASNGSGVTTMSVCAWVYSDNLPASSELNVVAAKYTGSVSEKVFIAGLRNNSGTQTWELWMGHTSGTSMDIYAHGSAPSADTWYFVCWSADASNVYIKVRDTNGSTVGSDYSTSLSNTWSIDEDTPLEIGAADRDNSVNFFWDGYIDELLVFDRVIDATDCTDLAEGDY